MSGAQDDKFATAAEHVLGLGDAKDAEAFHRQMATDGSLRKDLIEAGEGLAALAELLSPVSPPPRLKERLLRSVRSEPPRPTLGAVRADEGKWRPSGVKGISFKKLYVDKVSGLVTTLVRLEPGAVLPAHRHSRTEQCLVLEGDLIHDDHTYGPGDFTWAEAGSVDPELTTRQGALLLIVGGRD